VRGVRARLSSGGILSQCTGCRLFCVEEVCAVSVQGMIMICVAVAVKTV